MDKTRKDNGVTAMQELHKHFVHAWSSPGDLWRPDLIIEKVEEMVEKEKQQIINAYLDGTLQFSNDAEIVNPKTPEDYYNEKFKSPANEQSNG